MWRNGAIITACAFSRQLRLQHTFGFNFFVWWKLCALSDCFIFLTFKFPTITKPSNRKRQYDTCLIAQAFKDVTEKGVSVYKAARMYYIPETTLRDRKLGNQPVSDDCVPSCGQPSLFTSWREKVASPGNWMSSLFMKKASNVLILHIIMVYWV